MTHLRMSLAILVVVAATAADLMVRHRVSRRGAREVGPVLVLRMEEGDFREIRSLLDDLRDPNCRIVFEGPLDDWDGPPLVAAVLKDRADIVRLLLGRGARPNERGRGRIAGILGERARVASDA